jgi:hypothetical protein
MKREPEEVIEMNRKAKTATRTTVIQKPSV